MVNVIGEEDVDVVRRARELALLARQCADADGDEVDAVRHARHHRCVRPCRALVRRPQIRVRVGLQDADPVAREAVGPGLDRCARDRVLAAQRDHEPARSGIEHAIVRPAQLGQRVLGARARERERGQRRDACLVRLRIELLVVQLDVARCLEDRGRPPRRAAAVAGRRLVGHRQDHGARGLERGRRLVQPQEVVRQLPAELPERLRHSHPLTVRGQRPAPGRSRISTVRHWFTRGSDIRARCGSRNSYIRGRCG